MAATMVARGARGIAMRLPRADPLREALHRLKLNSIGQVHVYVAGQLFTLRQWTECGDGSVIAEWEPTRPMVERWTVPLIFRARLRWYYWRHRIFGRKRPPGWSG